MKCERCEFAPPVGPEGGQDECGCFEKYGTVWKDGSYGCTLNYQTLRKWDEERMNDMGDMGTDMGVKMDFDNRGWDMEQAIRNMMHMVGMYPEGCRHAYKRHGKIFYKPYRNYWAGFNKYLDYFIKLDITRRIEPKITGDMPYYILTDEGRRFLGRHLNVTIYPKED